MKKPFCPNCGSSNKPFLRGFCADCFVQLNKLVEFPLLLELVQCRECGKMLLNGKWHPFSMEPVLHWVKGRIKTKELQNVRFALEPSEEEKSVWVRGKIIGEIGEVMVEKPVLIEIKLRSSLCQDCSKLSANYYESVLQLRLDSLSKKDWKRVLDETNRLVEIQYKADSLARVTNIVQLKNGFDVYIGSKRAGKTVSDQLAKKFGGKITRSFSLAGVDKSGNTRKRFTFLVRI
jgi:nonsense-mediated mRNA decay protein 3